MRTKTTRDTVAFSIIRDREAIFRGAVYVLTAAAITLPFTRRGWLLLLDWLPGPHERLARPLWGLDGSLLASYPHGLATFVLGKVFGPALLGWVPLAAALIVAAYGMDRLVGGPTVRRLPAALLYVVNPIMFDRIFVGHFSFLAGYAVMPFVVSALRTASGSTGLLPWAKAGLWVAVAIGMAPHFAWITVIVCIGVFVASPTMRTALGLGIVGATTLACSAYLLVSAIGRQASVAIGTADLSVFRTTGDSVIGLFANVLGLYGFWRQEPVPPKHYIPGWFVFLAGMLFVCGVGLYVLVRNRSRFLLSVCAVTGPVCYFLALGTQGPTGRVYTQLFLHVPGFAIMREPQKFIVGLALVYAVLFGFGAERLVAGLRPWNARLMAGACIALVIAYTPTLFWGLGGQIHVSHYPRTWSIADERIGTGPGKLLFLPWHQYMAHPFTTHTVVNPASVFFRRNSISGDNTEITAAAGSYVVARSGYLEYLFAHGPDLTTFGQLTAPLGVEYIALAKSVDWQSYEWLRRQHDLTVLYESDEIVVFKNSRYEGIGSRTRSTVTVADWGEVVGLSEAADLSNVTVRAERLVGGPIRKPDVPLPLATPAITRVRQRSPVRYDVPAGAAGLVTVAEPYDSAWHLGKQSPIELASGTLSFRVSAQPASIVFTHWRVVRAGLLVSVFSFGTLLVVFAIDRRRRGPSDASQSPLEPSGVLDTVE